VCVDIIGDKMVCRSRRMYPGLYL